MANFTAADVKRLRGAKDVGKRAERTAANGLVAEHFNGSGDGALLELNCETDFVAKNEGFIALAQRIVEFAAGSDATDGPTLLGLEIEPGKTVQALIEENSAKIG